MYRASAPPAVSLKNPRRVILCRPSAWDTIDSSFVFMWRAACLCGLDRIESVRDEPSWAAHGNSQDAQPGAGLPRRHWGSPRGRLRVDGPSTRPVTSSDSFDSAALSTTAPRVYSRIATKSTGQLGIVVVNPDNAVRQAACRQLADKTPPHGPTRTSTGRRRSLELCSTITDGPPRPITRAWGLLTPCRSFDPSPGATLPLHSLCSTAPLGAPFRWAATHPGSADSPSA